MGDSHLVADDDGEATPLVPLHVVLGIAGRKAGRHASAVPGPPTAIHLAQLAHRVCKKLVRRPFQSLRSSSSFAHVCSAHHQQQYAVEAGRQHESLNNSSSTNTRSSIIVIIVNNNASTNTNNDTNSTTNINIIRNIILRLRLRHARLRLRLWLRL